MVFEVYYPSKGKTLSIAILLEKIKAEIVEKYKFGKEIKQ